MSWFEDEYWKTHCWSPFEPEPRDDPRDDPYEYRELSWEATPDYDALMERGDDEVAEEEDWGVWLAEGERRVPNG